MRFVRDYDYSNFPDPFFDVWEQAVFVLGERQVREAVEPLVEALRVPDHDVRSEAANALAAIGDERAVEPLARIVLEEDIDSIVPTCYQIENALQSFESDEAKRALAQWKAREKAWWANVRRRRIAKRRTS